MALFLISAPSGAGKTTLVKDLQGKNFWTECISHTTRPMREGEEEGVTYHYVDMKEFLRMDYRNEFAEVVTYDGNKYGITKSEIADESKHKKHKCIIVDHDGYQQLKTLYPKSVGIFLYMTKEECLANMLLRGDSIEKALKRIETYDNELKNSIAYDYVVKNIQGNFGSTATILTSIVLQCKSLPNY